MLFETGMEIRRSWIPILLMFIVYIGAATFGGVMVHRGNAFALHVRDGLVAQARAQDPASLALAKGNRLQGAVWDFSRNVVLGAIPNTVGGLAIGIPYLTAMYRGWVGGIVSVDSRHISRLQNSAERVYYLVTLLLQLIPYSLAGGVGVQLGLSYLGSRRNPGPMLMGLPREAVRDVIRVYMLVVPLFALASLWEFLMR